MSKRTILGISMACMFAGLSCFTGCKKEGEKTALQVSDIAFTECISHREAGQKGHHHPDSVVVSCKRHTIYVTHHYLTVNCGWNRIDVQYHTSNDSIFIRELDTPNMANCICETDNSFQINNVPQGDHVLVFESCEPVCCKTVRIR